MGNDQSLLGYQREILSRLERYLGDISPGARVLDAGCGTGRVSHWLEAKGYRVDAVDNCEEALAQARLIPSGVRFFLADLTDSALPELLGCKYEAVVAIEVIEHLYSPQRFLANIRGVLEPAGRLFLTTPYHGYGKNLLLALTGRWDRHLQPECEGGHIKFWSRKSLCRLLEQTGFRILAVEGIGRLPWLWKSLLVCCERGDK